MATASFAEYKVWLCEHDGTRVKMLFPGNDFMTIAWGHKLNDMSAWFLELVAETETKDSFIIDYGIEVERNYGSGFYTEFHGLYSDSEERLTSGEVDEHYWQAMGFSPEWLLNQPLLQPRVDNRAADGTIVYYDMWWRSGPGDDVMKAMVDESMGGSAFEETRRFPNFSVQGQTGEGFVDCYEGRWDRLLGALQSVAGEDKAGADFRVVPVTGGYEFRTYAPRMGTDRRRGNTLDNVPTIFSLELKNVNNPRVRHYRSQEVTAAYGGWQGEGAEQSIYSAINSAALTQSPFRRREAFYNLRDVPTAASVPTILNQALLDDGAMTYVSFNPIQTPSCLYGRDWVLGDLVTLDIWGESYDMRIVNVSGKLDGTNEEQIEGVAEYWIEPAPME